MTTQLIGHVGGAPFEEMVLPFLVTSGPLLAVAARHMFNRAMGRGTPRRESRVEARP